MAIAVLMPKQGQSVETCIITKWFKNKGEGVSIGDILLSYETDKAAFDLEAPAEGILLDVFYNEGDEVPVLVNVAVIGNIGEDTGSFKAGISTSSVKGVQEHTGVSSKAFTEAPEIISPSSLSYSDSRIRISPRAKRLADEKKISYSDIRGSGPNGRIITRDIEKILSGDISAGKKDVVIDAGFTEMPLSNVRRIVARTMYASLQNSAQLTHHMSADVRHLLDARQIIKNRLANDKSQQDITLNDMLCWCVIRALEKYPEINSHFLNDTIRTFSKVHLGLAVDTTRGLMVPALRNADDMDLVRLSKELRSLADSCRKGSISPEIIQSTSASFTVSNLGNYGVEMFTPVINLPQSGILGICTIINRPASLGNNILGFVPYIGLSLTYDHRAIDGGPATLFLKEIKEQIESFRYQDTGLNTFNTSR